MTDPHAQPTAPPAATRHGAAEDRAAVDPVASVANDLAPLLAASRRAQEELDEFREQYRHQRRDEPLRPRSLHDIRKSTRRYLDVQAGLAAVLRRATPLADGRGLAGGAGGAPARHALSLALAASVLRLDNLLAILPLLADRRYRRLVNHADLGYGIGRNELWRLVENLSQVDTRRRLLRLLARWRGHRPDTAADAAWADVITSSTTYALVHDAQLDQRLPSVMEVRRERILDGLRDLGDSALYALSEGFGNAIGRVELRKGKLWEREDVLGHLHRVLRPLDVLIEKTPFRLTDFFIPGHFGHVAIWMGRPRKLKRLRIWKHEEMQSERLRHCRPLIEDGRGVLEALRRGVELNALRVFANVDDLAILRPTTLKKKEMVASLVRGFKQVGKEYDFNFDVETTDTIVCSELPYHVYSDVNWSTGEALGRFTISPDHVARAALQEKPDFGLVAFYHDGALVRPEDAKQKLAALLR